MPPKSSGEIQMLFLSRWAYNSEPLIKEITRRTSKEQRTTQRRLISHFWPKFRYTLTRLVATCVYTGRIIYCSPAVFWVGQGDWLPFLFSRSTQNSTSFEIHRTSNRSPTNFSWWAEKDTDTSSNLRFALFIGRPQKHSWSLARATQVRLTSGQKLVL